jgi:hypothetical protein
MKFADGDRWPPGSKRARPAVYGAAGSGDGANSDVGFLMNGSGNGFNSVENMNLLTSRCRSPTG